MKKLLILLSLLSFLNAITFPIDFSDCKQIGKTIVLTGWFSEKRAYGLHEAWDVPADRGTIIRAIIAGKVIRTGYEYPKYDKINKMWRSGYGNFIDIGVFEIKKTVLGEVKTLKYYWRVAHLENPTVKVGDIVYESQKIGEVGSTGIVDINGRPFFAYHLHFEKRLPNGTKVNCLAEFTPLVQDYFNIETKKVFATIGSPNSNN